MVLISRLWRSFIASFLCFTFFTRVVYLTKRAWSLIAGLNSLRGHLCFLLKLSPFVSSNGNKSWHFKPWDEYECSPYWNPDILFYKSGEFVRSGHSIFGDQLVYFHEVCARSSSSSAWKITCWSGPSLGSGSPVRAYIPKQQLVIDPNLRRPVQLK